MYWGFGFIYLAQSCLIIQRKHNLLYQKSIRTLALTFVQ